MKKTALIALLLLTGCASPTTTQTAGLKSLLNDQRMAWLGQHLDDQEWAHLNSWLTNALIPYVTVLEYDASHEAR